MMKNSSNIENYLIKKFRGKFSQTNKIHRVFNIFDHLKTNIYHSKGKHQ